ncbi:MAG: 30S ribosomal protein S6e [Candidatus Micrarchaeia archaeon]
MKLNISEKSGATHVAEIDAGKASALFGKKIGDEIDGELIGAAGYALKITGGSDTSGFPMRPDVPGTARKSVLLSSGPGIRKGRKGERRRKSVRGNTVSAEISQLNLVVVKEGAQKLAELFPKKEGAEKKKEEKPAPKKKK